jgi:hypothetical protein
MLLLVFCSHFVRKTLMHGKRRVKGMYVSAPSGSWLGRAFCTLSNSQEGRGFFCV